MSEWHSQSGVCGGQTSLNYNVFNEENMERENSGCSL